MQHLIEWLSDKYIFTVRNIHKDNNLKTARKNWKLQKESTVSTPTRNVFLPKKGSYFFFLLTSPAINLRMNIIKYRADA